MHIKFKVAALILILFLLPAIGCKDKTAPSSRAAEKLNTPLVINAAMDNSSKDMHAGGDGTSVLTDVIARQYTSIFILDDTSGQIAVYNTSDFGLKQNIQIPMELYNKAKMTDRRYSSLDISDSGHILFYSTNNSADFSTSYTSYPGVPKIEGPATFTMNILYWDGSRWIASTIIKTLPVVSYRRSSYLVQSYDQISSPTLDSKAAVIYWMYNRTLGFHNVPDYYSYATTIRGELYRAHIQDGELAEELIGTILYDECECGTGACEETCPTSRLVSPSTGIKDSIEIEHYIQGQLEPTIAGKTLLMRDGDWWITSEINRIYDKPVIIYDKYTGCCGWVNESGGEIELLVNGNKTKLFDEWEKFDNRSFNVSFFLDNIELSSDMQKIAYTLDPGDWTIRDYKQGIVHESSVGGVTPEKLEAIKASLANSPMIEVKSTTEPVTQLLELHNAEFIGWLDNNTLLIFKDGHLGKLNLDKKEYTESPLTATSSKNIFLR